MKYAKVGIFVVLVVAILVADHFFGWSGWIASGELQRALEAMIGENYVAACALYVLLSIVGSVVLALPGILFALAAGAIFGPLVGTLLCWLSMSAGACGAFVAGRYFLKDALKPKLEQNKTLNKFLFEGADKSDVFLLAVTRLVPVFPFNLQNFAYGVTDIRFAPYALYTTLFILPGTAAYTIGAAGVVDAQNRVSLIAIAVVIFAVSFGIAWFLKRKADLA